MKKVLIIGIILSFCLPAYALEKQTTYKHLVTESGQIRVQVITKILDNGKEVSNSISPWSSKISPNDSVVSKDARTSAIMAKLKTLSIVAPTITDTGLEKTVTYDNSVTPDGHVQVRRITRVYENGVFVGKSYHRYVISPGNDYSKADSISKATAEAVQTQAVIDAYNASVAAKIN